MNEMLKLLVITEYFTKINNKYTEVSELVVQWWVGFLCPWSFFS